jgi:hypothetical protein
MALRNYFLLETIHLNETKEMRKGTASGYNKRKTNI